MAYMNQSNAAEKRLPQVEVFERPEITALPENRNIKKRVPYFRYGLMTAAVFIMLISMLTGYSKVAQLTVEADRLRSQLEELRSDGDALNAKREQRFNLEYVEWMAVNKLGMVKQDKSQITYLATSNPEKITIAAQEEENQTGLMAGLTKGLNVVMEYLD